MARKLRDYDLACEITDAQQRVLRMSSPASREQTQSDIGDLLSEPAVRTPIAPYRTQDRLAIGIEMSRRSLAAVVEPVSAEAREKALHALRESLSDD